MTKNTSRRFHHLPVALLVSSHLASSYSCISKKSSNLQPPTVKLNRSRDVIGSKVYGSLTPWLVFLLKGKRPLVPFLTKFTVKPLFCWHFFSRFGKRHGRFEASKSHEFCRRRIGVPRNLHMNALKLIQKAQETFRTFPIISVFCRKSILIKEH